MNAQVASNPDSLFFQGIRGQVLQAFTAPLSPEQSIAPFMGVEGASGTATVRFESGGTVLCFDASIDGFDPMIAHLNFAAENVNGPVILDFSSTRVGTGRFFGCLTIAELGIDIEAAKSILADGYIYNFDFHEGEAPPDFDFTEMHGASIPYLNTIRGQLPRVD